MLRQIMVAQANSSAVIRPMFCVRLRILTAIESLYRSEKGIWAT
jgi:hypothetical protein